MSGRRHTAHTIEDVSQERRMSDDAVALRERIIELRDGRHCRRFGRRLRCGEAQDVMVLHGVLRGE
jgi:hypothetical protein